MSYYVTVGNNTITHKIKIYLWCHVPVLHSYVLDSLDEFVDELLYYVVVLRVSFLDSLDEFVDELPYHVVALGVSFLDCFDEFLGELLYYVVVPAPFFQDYPHEVVVWWRHCVPAPSGA